MRMLSQRFAFILVALITGTAWAQTPADASPTINIDAVSSAQPLRDGIQIQSGPGVLRITALRDDIIRVRVSPNSALPEDASWAVLSDARTKSIDVQPSQDSSSVGF